MKILQMFVLVCFWLSAINVYAIESKDTTVNKKTLTKEELKQKEIEDAKKAEQLAFVSELLDNPFSNLWIITLSSKHFNASNSITGQDYQANQILFQPIIPAELNSKLRLISRPTFTFYTQHNIINPEGGFVTPDNNASSAGFGDFALISMLAPNKNSGYIWAIGPSVSTALTKNEFSSENPGIGFSVAQIYLAEKYHAGALYIQNFQLNSNMDRQKRASVQYFIGYKLNDKWSIDMAPTAEINWSAPKGEKFNIPLGLGIGRTMIVGIPLRLSVEVDRYVITPDNSNIKPETVISLNLMTVIPNLVKYHDRLF